MEWLKRFGKWVAAGIFAVAAIIMVSSRKIKPADDPILDEETKVREKHHVEATGEIASANGTKEKKKKVMDEIEDIQSGINETDPLTVPDDDLMDHLNRDE